LHGPYLSFVLGRESYWTWSLYLRDGWMAYFCATSSVEVGIYVSGVYVILIMKAWKVFITGHKVWQNPNQRQAAWS
jgi:hypothetical protein